ncbi:error-prone DNA polymerase [Sphingobium sp. BS19]|uniref:error-prone DNA polymerase n=1 Tax=Sphingobium sp. BS19 TaxID=3018973 RepID=UPI0022ED8847|nr:error-prone DNA polymerase [Sphingobium sp. BS19]GLI99831.1 error-prone DNA polymerase [Sphingobium sp. BS19]
MKRGRDPAHVKAADPRGQQASKSTRLYLRQKQTEGPDFAELVAATNFSFLRGASHPSDMVGRANELGLKAIGIADRNSVAGVVRAWKALKDAPNRARNEWIEEKKKRGEKPDLTPEESAACETDLRLVTGARLVFVDGTPDIVAYPVNRDGWGNLTKLLTVGNMKAVKGDCILTFDDLLLYARDLLLIVMPGDTAEVQEAHRKPVPFEPAQQPMPVSHLRLLPPSGLEATLRRLSRHAPKRIWLAATLLRNGSDERRLAELIAVSKATGVPLLATNDALYAEPDHRPLHDALTCIRHGVTLADAGRRLEVNAERHLKPAAEMARLFRSCPEAVAQTIEFLSRIHFTLDHLRYQYPREPVPEGRDPVDWLEEITFTAAYARYGYKLPYKLRALLKEEFDLIRSRKYAYYFLTVYDIVAFARSQEPPILCQGRGSAANSMVCFLLGITSVDPMQHDLLFSRFVSDDRDEPPDIDVDFEHERREEVMQYVYERYGRERAGIVSTVIHYRSRSAVREMAKVLGLSEDVSARLASTIWGSWSGDMGDARIVDAGFALDNPQIVRLRALVDQLIEAPFPRHLSQHVGGFVLTQDRLDETVPILNGAMANRSFIEWDKDDIDALGLMKVDVLALGMLTCIRKAFDLMEQNGFGRMHLTVDLTSEDKDVYAMLEEGDSIGVFQVESRAQINMLPRLKPKCLYDLTVQVAIVRPGPIEGDMVHPYLRRREGAEKVTFPSPASPHPRDELVHLLGKTFGVPLFQEQAMKLAITAGGFTAGEANQLRRAMATFRNVGGMDKFKEKLVGGMVGRGYEADFAERCFKQIEGFGSYGFPESHALSFARLVYVSAWIKCHHPAIFACALLNSQPMGFYAPAQIVRDAHEHGVPVHPVDVNFSCWDNAVERAPIARRDTQDWRTVQRLTHALRLGFRQIDSFREDWAQQLVAARRTNPFTSIEDLARRAHLPDRALRLLADGDACRSLGQDRREALWEVRRTPSDELPLFAAARTRDLSARELGEEPDAFLPAMPLSEQVAIDYQTARLSLKGHPMQFLRNDFAAEGVLSCAQISAAKSGTPVRAAGIVLVRQRPGKGNAIFITLEDETGVTNILLWARLFEMQRRPVMASRLMIVEGEVQRSKEGVVHVMATRIHDRTAMLDRLSDAGPTPIDIGASDGSLPSPGAGFNPQKHPRDVRILPKSRDFH